jgi:two-component system, chemotaxis family, CheB/CheR fusion protein
VGIGASAGGLEALVELFGALGATGMPFVVVQHLDPTHESLLPEILAKKTRMPVSMARAGEALKPDHVYVIPPDALLTVREGLIEIKPRPSAPERPFPVDLLFSSLAAAYGERAIGVVLSGGDADGSLGLREIKHAGGLTFAQQPESARFPTMPRHAIETGCVDLVSADDFVWRDRTSSPNRRPRPTAAATTPLWFGSSAGLPRRTAWTSPTTSVRRSGVASSGA